MAEWKIPRDQEGDFIRDESRFRQWVKADGSTPYLPEKNRYHLYVSLACPWSHRAVIVRSMRGLEDTIGLSVTHPVWNEKGWCFNPGPGVIPDSVNQCRNVLDLYHLVDPGFSGDETVPILWDKKTSTLVNNESLDIIQMMDLEFNEFATGESLFPRNLHTKIIEAIEENYTSINNGVYRAGFADNQKVYERAVRGVFRGLDRLEALLANQRYLCGDRLTGADLCLFVTLLRFDSVYYSHFKCSIRRITEYPHLWAYTRELFQIPEIRRTCDFEHIKQHYFGSHKQLNPSGIIPLGPDIDFTQPHDRERMRRS